jgi:hypothetical protein
MANHRGSPEWWLMRLGKRLESERPRFDRLESYWSGNPPLPQGNRRMREAYRRLQRLARTNFGSLVAEAVLERLKVIGFRAGGDSTDDADKEAWRWWQHNHLDADAGLVHRAAVVLSRSYVIVGDDPDDPTMPLVTVEDPRFVIHEASPTNRRKVDAALKTWFDDTENTHFAVLYMPDTVYYFRSTQAAGGLLDTDTVWKPERWTPDLTLTPDGSAPNPDGVVPVVPFINRPALTPGTSGMGEFEDVLDVLDRINTVILDRLVISAMQAYRQRWAKGVRMTDEEGNDTNPFDPGADLLWAVEDDAAAFGEFQPTDVTPIVKAAEADVQHLSAITRTPPHYILSGIVNVSGDALAQAETGLTSKVQERQAEFGEAWESVYRLVGMRAGRKISDDAEVLWKNPQFRSMTEMASAALQLASAGVPWRTRMRMLDMTPADIERMETERMQDAMTAALLQPMVSPQLGVGAPVTGASMTGSPGAGPKGSVDEKPPTRKSDGGSAPHNAGNTAADDTRWQALYLRARSLGVKGASAMNEAQLLAVVGSA